MGFLLYENIGWFDKLFSLEQHFDKNFDWFIKLLSENYEKSYKLFVQSFSKYAFSEIICKINQESIQAELYVYFMNTHTHTQTHYI